MDIQPRTSNVTPWSFPARLRQARERLGLTQLDLATRSNMKRSRYCDIERGQVRCKRAELNLLARALGVTSWSLIRNSDWRPPGDRGKRPTSALGKRCRWQPELRKPAASYMAGALHEHRDYVKMCLKSISARTDLPRVREFLREVACRSILELMVVLGLLAMGARPVWDSPLRVGFRRWPVLLFGRQAGDCRHPGLEVEVRGVRILFLFQVTLQVRKGGPPELDSLVVLREPGGRNKFLAAEFDGKLHIEERDAIRKDGHEMAEVRIDWKAFQAADAHPVPDLCLRILEKMGVDVAEEATQRRMKILEKRRKATSRGAVGQPSGTDSRETPRLSKEPR